ncbi:MAG: N-methyl-L-tryptophan oxidase [Pseudonocardiaceae bacterium]|nr:N-methyl-L-tryptophan oxidase [Pseudonocardiaceae bacterium]
MNVRPRVAVVGTGTIGAMTLWQLARRGVPAVGFDRFAPGHDRGAAGGQTRIFRTAYREGAEYVPLLQRAQALWRELEMESDRRLLTLSGALTIGPAEHPDVRAVLESARAYELDHELIGNERFPQYPRGSDEIAVLDRQAGFLRPEVGVAIAAGRAEQLGATIRRYAPVDAVEPAASGVRLHVDGAVEEFDHVVLAPGPWAGQLDLLTGFGPRARWLGIYWFPARDPRDFRPEDVPVAMRVGDSSFSCVPSLDEPGAKVLPRLGFPEIDDPAELPRTADVDSVAKTREMVAEHLPGLHPDPIRIGVYTDCFAPDDHAVVGPLPGHDTVTIMTGFSGHGFKLAPVFGEIASELVTEGTTKHDIAHLDPRRFA